MGGFYDALLQSAVLGTKCESLVWALLHNTRSVPVNENIGLACVYCKFFESLIIGLTTQNRVSGLCICGKKKKKITSTWLLALSTLVADMAYHIQYFL